MKIGTPVDDHAFRLKTKEETKSGVEKYKQIKSAIDDFSVLDVGLKAKDTLA